jgi:hypothetical protein
MHSSLMLKQFVRYVNVHTNEIFLCHKYDHLFLRKWVSKINTGFVIDPVSFYLNLYCTAYVYLPVSLQQRDLIF